MELRGRRFVGRSRYSIAIPAEPGGRWDVPGHQPFEGAQARLDGVGKSGHFRNKIEETIDLPVDLLLDRHEPAEQLASPTLGVSGQTLKLVDSSGLCGDDEWMTCSQFGAEVHRDPSERRQFLDRMRDR